MIRFLVLDGGGYLGRAICAHLEDRPGVEAVPHVRTGTAGGMDLASASVEDVAVFLAESGAQVVVNCISATSGGPERMLDRNVRLVARILSALSGRTDVRLVQIGSAAEYAESSVRRPVREADLPIPVDDFGRTKLTATRLVLGAAAQGRVHGTVLRVFDLVGPGAPEETLLGEASRRIEDALAAGESAVRLGPLSGWRDHIDVRDVAAAVEAAGTSPQASGAVLNVGSGVAVPQRAVVEMLASEAGFGGEIVDEPRVPASATRMGWQQADITAIHARLGWAPVHDIAASVHASWVARRAASPR
jgi:nucleoside-diphosphate-sugar epimerase